MFLQKIFPTDKLTNFPFSVYLFTQKSPWREREREREPEREREREREREIDRARERANERESDRDRERLFRAYSYALYCPKYLFFSLERFLFTLQSQQSQNLSTTHMCVKIVKSWTKRSGAG